VVSGDPPEGDPSSRRGVLRAAGAAAGGLLVTACGHASLKALVHNSAPLLNTDVELLNHLLDLEHWAIAAYTAGTPLLPPAVVKAGQLFLNDELSHAGALAGLVKAAGGKPGKPAASYPLGHPRSSDDVLKLLHDIENRQLTAYLSAVTVLEPGFVKASVASILANDAQHVAVLRAALHRPAVPSPFETGRA